MALHSKSDFLLILLCGILSTSRASICATNRDSRALINGVNSNIADSFLRRLRETRTFNLMGDNINHNGYCRSKMQRFVHIKGQLLNDIMLNVSCWEPVECTLVEGPVHNLYTLSLVSKPWLNRLLNGRIKAVLLPIDERNSISYTFLPRVHQRSALFVTSLLSGCSIFVATASDTDCNIIVMHANRFVGRNEPEDDDDNHKQAMFVIENVQSGNPQCRYQIHRRWAADYKKDDIERHRYQYSNNILYYDTSRAVYFLYGYIDGHNRKWQFCIKELLLDPRQEVCSLI